MYWSWAIFKALFIFSKKHDHTADDENEIVYKSKLNVSSGNTVTDNNLTNNNQPLDKKNIHGPKEIVNSKKKYINFKYY